MIYGSQHLVFNTHSLIHLADDTKKFGVLDSVSFFPFENYLGTLKRLVRRPQNPLQQVVTLPFDHGKEMRNKLQQPHLNGPTLPEFPARMQYKKYRHEANIISCSKGNICFDVEGRVTVVRNILEGLSGATDVTTSIWQTSLGPRAGPMKGPRCIFIAVN